MKSIFFAVLWLSPVLNAALYWYRKMVDAQRKEGKILKAGVHVHKAVISGPKNWVWFRHFFEDVLLKACLAAIPAMILKDATLFLILLSVGLVALIAKIGITFFPFPWPVFFFLAQLGTWTFYYFTFYYVRGFAVFILGVLAPAAILVGAVDLFSTAPILLSEPTALARFLGNSTWVMPTWVYYALVIPCIALMVANIFYLWLKITPLFTRFYVEYNDEVLRLISRMSKKEIIQIDFKKPYAYEQAFDERLSSGSDPIAYIFAQDNKAIAITEGLYGSLKKDFPVRRRGNSGLGFPIWQSKLSGKASVTYVVTPEECAGFFAEIVKKHWKER